MEEARAGPKEAGHPTEDGRQAEIPTSSRTLGVKGRNDNEEAFVLIKNGSYLGYGFIDKSESINHQDELETFLIPQKDNINIQNILRNKLVENIS